MIFISLSDIVNQVYSPSGRIKVAVSLVDRAFHVKIGDVELGIRNHDDPDSSQPNPIEIEWTQEMEIVIHKTVGQRPLTQCTIPSGLWNLTLKFNTLKGTDGDISQTLETIRDMDAGPRPVYDALFKKGKCMYLQKKRIVQPKGSKDWYHSIELTLLEANGGAT